MYSWTLTSNPFTAAHFIYNSIDTSPPHTPTPAQADIHQKSNLKQVHNSCLRNAHSSPGARTNHSTNVALEASLVGYSGVCKSVQEVGYYHHTLPSAHFLHASQCPSQGKLMPCSFSRPFRRSQRAASADLYQVHTPGLASLHLVAIMETRNLTELVSSHLLNSPNQPTQCLARKRPIQPCTELCSSIQQTLTWASM